MFAPSFKISTCAATIPASSTPSSGIHARPRTTLSSHGWSGSDTTNAPMPRAMPIAGFPPFALRVSGAGLGTTAGRGAGSRPMNGRRSGSATAAATAAEPVANAPSVWAGRLARKVFACLLERAAAG